MKQWNKRSVLLGFLVAWMAFSPVFLFAAESPFTAHSFLCQYLNFVLQPVGLCQKLPAAPTVIPGVALSPVQKNFIVASAPVVPFAVVPQVLGVATSGPMLVPTQSVVIDPTNKQNSVTTGSVISATAIISGALMNGGLANNATTGSVLRITSGGNAIAADYTGNVVDISPARTLSAVATRNDSGNYLKVQRANTTNNASAILNITGTLAALSSNCTVTLGACNDSANLLALTQSYASASGDLLSVIGAGTGNLATLDATNAAANGMSIDVRSSSTSQYALRVTSNNSSTNDLYVRADGNVGIGTSTPSAQLTTTGTVRFANFGAGSLSTDADGNLSVSSDERLKDIQGNYTAGIDQILGITPILFKWNAASGLEQNSVYAGFSAQNVKEFLPDAVGEDKRGLLTLSDRSILAAVVNAIHQVWDKVLGIETKTTENAAAIDALRQENQTLKARLDALESPGQPAAVKESVSSNADSDVPVTSGDTATATSDSVTSQPVEEVAAPLPAESTAPESAPSESTPTQEM